ncbi:chromatin remodelling complex Rsc7/Swp82 subunit-domain-containing protein [Lineolata rhizophorae]|uniref:Chromatin remodelling complex Rsc7/Swp82 subunit-domain-containing protein n=1 Tax=Lineolata rhizophorae TaxID=578093 RepID=A0A6A6PAS8_9PEZI|nr:chromatin remodelling complex Rsc7/Swp82 subunit-domain-containing protein [Lineolata rhizophorae]
MYSVSHPVAASMNGGITGGSIMDPSGTINPAALNTSGVLQGSPSNVAQASPRGVKRSRSPDDYVDVERGDEDDSKPRKRGRPPKTTAKVSESPGVSTQAAPPQTPSGPAPVQTPQLNTQTLPQPSPTQASPPKSTPTKGAVVKALPTVRDHTTDQLNPDGDEYIPREIDEAGEKKVSPSGHPLDGREYRCRTFLVPKRGDKLFMLATECARVLGYRDSYLLFNKNRSLYKIIATQAEKDDLIAQEILPYSYRSRQIAIVTARSMFRQFGSRLIVNGRRVRDDYWESKARKQGFTEEDAAGEKRPGAAKAREAAAAESGAHALTSLPHGEIIYSNGPAHLEGQHGMPGMAHSLAPLPMINLAPTDDMRPRDYGNVQRPRQEISGPPYQDRIQASTPSEILQHAGHTAEWNKGLTSQRSNRGKYLEDIWKRPHEPQILPTQHESAAPISQSIQSPPLGSNVGAMGGHGVHHRQGPSSQPIAPQQAYTQQPHAQNIMAQSPVQAVHQPQMHHRPSGVSMTPGGGHGQPGGYGYQPGQMWPPPQPQPSPLSQSHHNMPPYGQQHGQQQQPHQQQHSPLQAPPQLHHSQSSGSMHHGAPMGYPGMGGMGSTAGYPGVGRNPYQPSPSPQQFMHQSTAAQQPGMPGWAPGPPGSGQQQGGWQQY